MIDTIAASILALINSKPSSPTQKEIEARIRECVGYIGYDLSGRAVAMAMKHTDPALQNKPPVEFILGSTIPEEAAQPLAAAMRNGLSRRAIKEDGVP